MTSKDLFFKLLWRDVKSRIWVTAVVLVVFAIRFPILGLASIDTRLRELNEKYITQKELIQEIVNWVSPNGLVMLTLIVLSAALCAFTGFAYLHSRMKLDVYHSIPIKRGKLLAIQYTGGLLIFLIPFLSAHLFYFVICLAKGIFSAQVGIQILGHIAAQISMFLLFYNIAITAIMLTGRLLVGLAAFAVIGSYYYVIRTIVLSYVQTFFYTFYLHYEEEGYPFIGRFQISKMNSQKAWIALLAAVLLAVLNIWLYKRRPSEAAERSIAFSRIEPWLKILMMIPFSLGCGIFARAVNGMNQDAWMVVGIVFGLLVSHCLIEVIYSYDMKSVVSHRISFSAACLGAVLVVVIFRFDLLGYDRYMPNKDDVVGMGIYVEQLGMNDYYGASDSLQKDLEEMHLEEMPEAYQIVETGITRAELLRSMNEEELMYEYGNTLYICYKLKNGRSVIRQYSIPLSEIHDELGVLYNDSEFKEGLYPILKKDIKSKDIIVNDIASDTYMTLSQNEIADIIEAYKQDVAALTFEEVASVSPVGSLTFIDSNQWYSQSYPMYADFENMLSELNKAGYEMVVEIDPEEILKIELYNMKEDDEPIVEGTDWENGMAAITDKEVMKKIIPTLVWDGSTGIETDADIYAIVYYEKGDSYGRYYSLRADML